MDERRGYRVEGRVQGVGFRWWTQRTGNDLGLRGDVWNRADGSVEVQVAGDEHALHALEEALSRGPSLARVDAVHRIPASGALPERGFHLEGR